MGEGTPTPEVFRDIITPTDAPSRQPLAPDAIGNSPRVQAVLDRLQRRTEEIAPHIDTQPTSDDIRKPVDRAVNEVAAAKADLEALDDLATESGPAAGLKARFTGRITETELRGKKSLATQDLLDAEAKAARVGEQVAPDVEAATTYNRAYLEKQAGVTRIKKDGEVVIDPTTGKPRNRNEELIAANIKGAERGPMTASTDMTDALGEQDRTQAKVKAEEEALAPLREQQYQYRLWELPDDEARMLPTEVYQAVRENITREHGYKTDEAVEAGIRFHQAAYDFASKYADQTGVTIDPEKYKQIVEYAQTNNWSKGFDNWREVDATLKRYIGTDSKVSTHLRNSPYAKARSELEILFNRLQIPEGAERVAYVMGYTASKLTTELNLHKPEHMLRDLLAESLPIAYLDDQGSTHEAQPLGLGYLAGPHAKDQIHVERNWPSPILPGESNRPDIMSYSETRARVLAAVQQANDMTRDFGEKVIRESDYAHRRRNRKNDLESPNGVIDYFQPIKLFDRAVYSAFSTPCLTQEGRDVQYYPGKEAEAAGGTDAPVDQPEPETAKPAEPKETAPQ